MEFRCRKVIRKSGYNYSFAGCYFITICAKDRKMIFGDIQNHKMVLNDIGNFVQIEILNIENNSTGIKVDKFVIMPNHIHLLVFLENDTKCFVENNVKSLNSIRNLSNAIIPKMVRHFKARVSRHVGECIWHSRYHYHIVRNQKEYEMIYNYIECNPMRWERDCYR